MELKAGQIVTVDWRKEPVVPMTGDPALAIPDLTVVLQPRPSNGCKMVSYLLPQNLTCVAKTRITAVTSSRIHCSRTAAAAPVGGADHWRAELTTPAALPPT